MQPFNVLTGRTLVLNHDHIDTDQIIPARFLKTTQRQVLGRHAFADWRYDRDGQPLADSPFQHMNGATILVAGHNFGCGSSREHAPWALLDLGFAAVIAPGFAEIFANNALKNGLLTVAVTEEFHRALLERPGQSVTIELERQRATAADFTVSFDIEPFAKHCLLQGVDPLGYLLDAKAEIARFEATREVVA